MSTNEHELIERARMGDPESFCQLTKRYHRRVFLLALHYCRNAHDAEDLSQEVWLKAYRAISKFRGEAGFYTWLRHIMINTFLNCERGSTVLVSHEKTKIRLEGLNMFDETEIPQGMMPRMVEDGLHKKMLVEKVMQALSELTPQQRLVFLLKHREGMTYEEISKACGCSTGAIKKSLFRAVTKLRQHLGVRLTAAEECVPSAAGENN